MSNVFADGAEPRPAPKRWVAMVLSILLVGCGHAYVGQARRAIWAVAVGAALFFVGVVVHVASPSPVTLLVLFAFALPLSLIRYALVVDILAMKASRFRATRWPTIVAATVGMAVVVFPLAFVMRRYVVEAFKIPAGSMMPTLLIGDHVFVSKFAYRKRPPARGDLAVFEFPEHPEKDLVKRVIAVPGDTLEVRSGHPWINGWEVPRCLVGATTMPSSSTGESSEGDLFVEFLDGHAYLVFVDRAKTMDFAQGPYRVPPNEYWVLGDNRNNSYDSRMWYGGRGGGVPVRSFRGRVSTIWLSVTDGGVDWSRFGLDMRGPPQLPSSMATLREDLHRCLQEAPANTSPPAP